MGCPRRGRGGDSYGTAFAVLLVLLPVLTGRTPGMWLAGLQIRRAADRGPARPWQQLVRGVLLPVDLVFLGLVGIEAMLLFGHIQRLGDLVPGTVVELDR